MHSRPRPSHSVRTTASTPRRTIQRPPQKEAAPVPAEKVQKKAPIRAGLCRSGTEAVPSPCRPDPAQPAGAWRRYLRLPGRKRRRSSRAERIRRDRPCRDAAASARPPRGSPPAFHPPARREACIRSARPPRGRRANRTPARGPAARLFRAEGAGCPRRQEYPDLPCRLSSHFLRTNRPMGRKYPVLPRGSAHFWADRETPQAHPSGGPAPQPARGGNWGAAAGGRGGAPPALPVPLQNRRFCAPAGAARSAGGRCFSRSVPAPGSAAAAGSAARAAPARRKEAPRALRRGRQARRPRRCGRCRAGGRRP